MLSFAALLFSYQRLFYFSRSHQKSIQHCLQACPSLYSFNLINSHFPVFNQIPLFLIIIVLVFHFKDQLLFHIQSVHQVNNNSFLSLVVFQTCYLQFRSDLLAKLLKFQLRMASKLFRVLDLVWSWAKNSNFQVLKIKSLSIKQHSLNLRSLPQLFKPFLSILSLLSPYLL